MNIGFIGLGIMGRPMAGHLIEAGHRLTINRLKPVSQHLADRGAKPADTPRAVAEGSDVVILMLPDTPDVENVLFGEDGVAEALRPGSLVIDMSSISPSATREFAQRIGDLGSDYVDAPVSGGEAGAVGGTLTIMAGGSEAAVARAMPLLEIIGKTITHIGESGAGQIAKVANQIVVGLTIEAVAEAMLYTEAAGADPAKVRAALMGGLASSRILEVHGDRMIRRAFEPGFRLRLHRKDIGLATSAARELGLNLPNTAGLEQQMNGALTLGLGDSDHAGLFKALATMSGR